MTLRPPHPVTEQIVELAVVGNLLCLKFREHNEAFRQLARELFFRWNGAEWRRERKITAQTGAAEDRLIEAAYKLIGAGFIVDVPEGIDADRVISGDYLDEHTRWIHKGKGGKYDGWFLLAWAYHEEFYTQARALPGSRYSKPYVAVATEWFAEIEDFATLYDFRFTETAAKLLAEAKAKRLAMVRVELRPRTTKEPAKVAQTTTNGVANEFLDTD